MVEILIKLLLAIIAISVLSAIAGSLAIFKKNTFMVVGVSHAALAGAAIGIIIKIKYPDFDPYFTTFLISVLISIAVTVLESRYIAGESGVGILFATSMSIAVLLLSVLREYPSKAWGYLIGDPYLLTTEDLLLISIIVILTLLIFIFSYHKIIFTIFDYHGAMAYGVRVKFYTFIIYLLISLTVVVLISAVGMLMVYTILILPPAIAKIISNNIYSMLIISFILSLLAGAISIYISLYFAIPISAFMGLTLSCMYVLTFIIRN